MDKRNIISFMALLALLLLPGALWAANGTGQQLVLTQAGGNVTKFALADNPIITYSGNDIVVTCGDHVLQTSMANITSVSFEKGSSSGIQELRNQEVNPTFSFNTASFEGLQTGSRIMVFTIDGKMISTVKADAEGKAHIDMSNLPSGVYILHAPNKSFKIKK